MLVFAGQTSMLRAQEEGAGTHEEERHGHDNAVALFLGGATHLGSDGQSSETGFARIRTRQLDDRSPSQCGPGEWPLDAGLRSVDGNWVLVLTSRELRSPVSASEKSLPDGRPGAQGWAGTVKSDSSH